MNSLSTYGWTPELNTIWENLGMSNMQPGRVVADFGTSLKVALPELVTAELSGKLAHYTSRQQTPKVGDWVAVQVSSNRHAVIELLVPRQSEIARKAAGNQTVKQVIAANVDVAFVLLAVGNDFNLDRLRRFLYQLSVSNVKPVIVLNKIDKTDDLDMYMSQLETFELPIIKTVATEGAGADEILEYIRPGTTAVLLGSSGVGKSTLTNRLLGESVQKTQTVRESDEAGKHTTVHRELFMLPGGGLLIDMPGIRELQLWGTEEDLADNFDDITALALHCKYTTCRHGSEEGCAVQQALQDGQLEQSRYAAYKKMKAELQVLEQRTATLLKRTNEKSRKTATHKRNYESRADLRDEMSN